MLEYAAWQAQSWVRMMTSREFLFALGFMSALLMADLAARGWRLSWSRRALGSVGATIAIFHLNFLFLPFVYLISLKFKDGYDALGIPSLPSSLWDGIPVWILTPFAVLAYDFANYWAHRVMHMKWLWPIHAIHHSDPDVSGITAYRVHSFELLVMWTSYTLLLTWLGLPATAIGWGAVFTTLLQIYVHIDRDWGHGPFALLLASPRFHRWHHADTKAAWGKNLANVFPFFDRVFGTYYVPGPVTASMGTSDAPGNDVARLALYPFLAWSRMLSRRIERLFRRHSAHTSHEAVNATQSGS